MLHNTGDYFVTPEFTVRVYAACVCVCVFITFLFRIKQRQYSLIVFRIFFNVNKTILMFYKSTNFTTVCFFSGNKGCFFIKTSSGIPYLVGSIIFKFKWTLQNVHTTLNLAHIMKYVNFKRSKSYILKNTLIKELNKNGVFYYKKYQDKHSKILWCLLVWAYLNASIQCHCLITWLQ